MPPGSPSPVPAWVHCATQVARVSGAAIDSSGLVEGSQVLLVFPCYLVDVDSAKTSVMVTVVRDDSIVEGHVGLARPAAEFLGCRAHDWLTVYEADMPATARVSQPLRPSPPVAAS